MEKRSFHGYCHQVPVSSCWTFVVMKRLFYENSISVSHDSIFIAITSSEIGWVPLWCKECSHKCNPSAIPMWWVSVLFSDTLLENRHPAAKGLDKICDVVFLFVCFYLNWGLCQTKVQHIRFQPASNYDHNQNTIYYLLFHHFIRYCQINALMHLFMPNPYSVWINAYNM